jgi:hypothetical protein
MRLHYGQTLFKVRSSCLIYYGNKIGNGTVPALFRIFGEITGGKLPVPPVVINTFTADTFLFAVKSTIAVFFVTVYIAGFCRHASSLYTAYHRVYSFSILGKKLY